MLTSFKHRGLEEFWETGDSRYIQSDVKRRIKVRLDVMEEAEAVSDIDFPGWNLHELKGDREGTWSLKVTAAWRITFRFEDGDCLDIDYEQYH